MTITRTEFFTHEDSEDIISDGKRDNDRQTSGAGYENPEQLE